MPYFLHLVERQKLAKHVIRLVEQFGNLPKITTSDPERQDNSVSEPPNQAENGNATPALLLEQFQVISAAVREKIDSPGRRSPLQFSADGRISFVDRFHPRNKRSSSRSINQLDALDYFLRTHSSTLEDNPKFEKQIKDLSQFARSKRPNIFAYYGLMLCSIVGGTTGAVGVIFRMDAVPEILLSEWFVAMLIVLGFFVGGISFLYYLSKFRRRNLVTRVIRLVELFSNNRNNFS